LEQSKRVPLRNRDITEIEFIGTCIERSIAKIAEKDGVRFSYPRLLKMLKIQYPEIYNDLALDFYNPWESSTKKVWHKGNYYIIMEHSMIDYVFKVIV